MFEPVAARYDGPELEKGILEFWRREDVFGRIMAEGAARPKFVFYEGPPTANGRIPSRWTMYPTLDLPGPDATTVPGSGSRGWPRRCRDLAPYRLAIGS